jgi:hypothetical protein
MTTLSSAYPANYYVVDGVMVVMGWIYVGVNTQLGLSALCRVAFVLFQDQLDGSVDG